LTGVRSEDCISSRRDARTSHRSIGQVSCRNSDRCSTNRHAVLQRPHRSGRESARGMQVRVVNAARTKPLRSMAPIVIDVHNSRVADIDAAEVTKTSSIPGEERLAETQRAPSKTSQGEAEIHAPAGTAKPGHQRGCVDRPRIDRSRSPSPVAARVNPAAIVEGRVSPRRVIDPGPAPRLNPDPVTILIRSPAWRHGTRNPHWPVRRNFAPYAIIIEVFIAHGSGSYVARGEGSILTLVAHCTPAVKAVIGRRFGRGVSH
jgi:hypothetical protein